MDIPQKRSRSLEATSETPESLSRPISPPRKRGRTSKALPSPWQLTWIQDLPESANKDAVTLKDLLGDPLIAECWQFNYLHDIPFIMDAFDDDTSHLVQLHIVHGFWKRDDANRQALMQQGSRFKNVELHCAPMPEMFGTHHSKMMVLFRHDDTAQVIIHTANMIPKDWTNMTNAVWKSPILPRMPTRDLDLDRQHLQLGKGQRFKADLLSYLRHYDSFGVICRPLVDKLAGYGFSGVQAALIASVPGRHDIRDLSQPTWGWAALKRCLQSIASEQVESSIVVQISSIATLGAKQDWLQDTLFSSLSASKTKGLKKPKFKIVFPTADEIRHSLDGYASGSSIHTKIQSPQQSRQLQYLRPMFHHWAGGFANGGGSSRDTPRKDGGRDRAAPHIKTYIRYNGNNSIDWALLTSANLSKQAWGEAVRPSTGDIRIASWEIGVLLWPSLFDDDERTMVSCYQSDTPTELPQTETCRSLIGLRIPYSTPLQAYSINDIPWVATMSHSEADCNGLAWRGFQ